MTRLVPPATAKARGEAAAIQKQIDAAKGGFQVTAADWDFYSEKVRKAEYDLDESEIRPYLDLERVLQDGVFFAATKMYGITFKERKDIPVYHPDVRVWEVFDADGSSLALYYGDFFLRPSKGGGAWCDSFVDQSRLLGMEAGGHEQHQLHQARRGPAGAALLRPTWRLSSTSSDMRSTASSRTWSTRRSDRTPRDFVEFPSAFNEHWAYEPTVFANYAKHSKTGEPMPAALVEKIKKTKTFNQGYITTEYLASALLDMAWHSQPAGATPQDVDAFEKSTLERRKVNLPEVPPRYRTTYFSHIWDGAYAAGLLRLLLVGGPRQRRLLLVQGERRHDAEERRPLPRHDPLARRERRRRGDVPGIPRPRSRDRALPRGARAHGRRSGTAAGSEGVALGRLASPAPRPPA